MGLQAAKKEKAAKKGAATADDDDLDALLLEFTKEVAIWASGLGYAYGGSQVQGLGIGGLGFEV